MPGIGHGDPGRVTEVMSALADPTRRSVFELLMDRGPMSASAVATGYDVSRQAIVKHLQLLEGSAMVTAERCGREVLYGVVPGALGPLETWLSRSQTRWERRLATLGRNTRSRARAT